MTGAAQANRASRMPCTARIGSTLMKGLDGQMITARSRSSPKRRQKVRMRPRVVRAVEGKLAHDGAALKAHEIVLEIEPALIRPQSGSQPIVGRRQHAGTDAEAAAEVGGDGGEARRPAPAYGCARHEPQGRDRQAETSPRRRARRAFP